jgi:Tfp pilus assembly protein PilP
MRTVLFVFCFGVLIAASASGQAPPAPAAPAQPPASPDAPPTPPPNYTYAAESRRDPFVNLLNRGGGDARQGAAGAARPEGVAGLTVDDIVIRGIVFSRGAWVAMVGAPNGRTYSIRAGDKLMDGSVRAINATTVILMQEVNDPLSLEKQREVRKYLRGEVK